MKNYFASAAIVLVLFNFCAGAPEKKIIHVELGGHCVPGAAPVGPGGSWQVVEKNVEKICPPGSSCRRGACNCDDVNGAVMSLSYDYSTEVRSCKLVAGQKCSKDDQCFYGVQCVKGVCTCDKSKPDQYCVDQKDDVTILA